MFARFTLRGGSVWLVASTALLSGCAAGQQSCQTNTWSGTCELVDTSLVRHVEVPVPSVLYQATYRTRFDPQRSEAGVPGMTIQKEFVARDRHETALRAHIETHRTVPCYVTPPAAQTCSPGTLTVEVPEFDALHAAVSEEDSGPKGCARIEAQGISRQPPSTGAGPLASIPENFEFPVGSAELSPEFAAPLDAIAERLKANPTLQCVAVVGAWQRGETMSLAFARSRAIREQLLRRGVQPERLLALTVDPRPPSPTGATEPATSEERRVNLRVLLEQPPADNGR